jgi:ADP-ribosylglycohydrolase
LVCAGETKPELAQAVARFEISHNTLAERLSRYNGLSDWQEQTDDNIHSSGWVIDTLEVALWAFFKYDDWAEGILAVVNLGGDSDTAGAVHGALAGAFLGFDAIPTEWVQGMQNRGLIEQVADDLSNLVAGSS